MFKTFLVLDVKTNTYIGEGRSDNEAIEKACNKLVTVAENDEDYFRELKIIEIFRSGFKSIMTRFARPCKRTYIMC